jgi:hypothetical protein
MAFLGYGALLQVVAMINLHFNFQEEHNFESKHKPKAWENKRGQAQITM